MISTFIFCYLLLLGSPLLQKSNALALEVPEQAQNAQNTKTEADRLFQQGNEQLNSGELQKALETYQQVLEIRRKIGDRPGEGEVLHKIGVVYHRLSQYHQAVEFYQKALEVRRNLGDRTGEAATLHNLGDVYRLLGQYQQALEVLQQALAIRQEFNDRAGVGNTLNHLGAVYQQMGDYYRALEFYQKALTISREERDRAGEGHALVNLGIIYGNLGEYVRALEFYQQALAIFKILNNPTYKAHILDRTGSTYSELGQYSEALNLYQQALATYQATNNKGGMATTLHNIGLVYVKMSQYAQALNSYQQALIIRKEIGDITGFGKTLNNLGVFYQQLGQYSQAIDVLNQALSIFQKLGNRKDLGDTLDSLGTVHQRIGQYSQALQLYQESLAIRKEVGDRPGEIITLSNIADVISKQNQPELAIIFYKESVNVTESIRSKLRSLPAEKQRSYTTTVADTYRRLADLLLQQDRVLEAQQVLDLLKIQEIEDYLHSVRGNEQTAQGIPLNPQEQQIRNRHNEILNREIQLGRKLAELEKIPVANRTPQQQQEIANFRQMQQEMRGTFNEFINSPEIVAIVQQLSPNARVQTVNLAQLNTIRGDLLQRLEKKAVLIQPLILEDRLELVITTADAPPFRRTVAVKKQELNQAILEFRMALEDPNSDATIPANKLYNWLIKPLEHDLSEAQAKSIIYAPDGQLRYIPLAALYDGKQWLGQRFAINNITATSLTKFNGETTYQPRVLAAAFGARRSNIERGSTRFAFSGLQFAGLEVENLAAMVPGTTKLIDREFNRATMIPRLPDYTIIHLATHAMFVTGQPEDSFILLGDGDTITMPDIQTLNLLNVDLVVLSACETGKGGILGNGEEILGFGYQIQETGAKAAIASLWKVDDGGTQALMTAFYTALLSGNKKAEALQKAQIALITGDDSVLGRSANLSILAQTRSGLKRSVASRLHHPYYWAPFILIGNGL
ncbi:MULTISPECIES: tetratricopeptide repeat protein [unclassified Microcoleus]|uniref:tetratricopeptide repeat protein n=1 Tax=unclassified Microcoleus TaxID=2642155 RepID=UPI002FD3F99C